MIDWKALKRLSLQFEEDKKILNLRETEAEVAQKAKLAAYNKYCKTQEAMNKALFPDD